MLFISALLAGVQLGPVSCLLFISVFWGRHHFLGQIGEELYEGTDENKFVSGIIF